MTAHLWHGSPFALVRLQGTDFGCGSAFPPCDLQSGGFEPPQAQFLHGLPDSKIYVHLDISHLTVCLLAWGTCLPRPRPLGQ
jgi:hypothetical protein